MAFDNGKRLDIPIKELIKPLIGNNRDKLFMEIIDEYKKRYPDIKLIYAYLNSVSSLGVDFCLIFKARAKADGAFVNIIECPMLYTERSISGYLYCKEHPDDTNNVDNYFNEALDLSTRITTTKFNEFITIMCELSLDSSDPLYWKSPNNIIKLIDKLSELSLRYNKPKKMI